MIALLNRYFVPVTSANEIPDGERFRIYHEFFDRHMGVGDVHVYVLGPDRAPIGGLDIGSALDTDKEITFLNDVIRRLHLQPGPTVFAPHPQSRPPAVEAGAPVIHLVSRRPGHNTWNDFPAENWISLTRAEWDQMLPPANAQPKATWQLPQPLSVKLAEWVFPQVEETRRTNRSRVDDANFRLTLATVSGNLARARIDAHVRLRHSFYPGKPAEDFANSTLVGYVDLDLAAREVIRFRLVTNKAEYQGGTFTCSLVSISRETIEAQR